MTQIQPNKALELQRQIRDNSQNISAYYKEFEEWVSEMNQKDKIMSQIKDKEVKPEPIISSHSSSTTKEANSTNPTKEKFRRDKNSIKNYYDNWDKVNPEEEWIDVDSGVIMNSDSITPQSLYNEKKKSNPNQNQQVRIQNSRKQYEVNTRVDKLKSEANANFAIHNYTKSIELYNYAISLLKEGDQPLTYINLYNNRGNCQIKLQNYNMGINDFNSVLQLDNNNVKALYRRGICYVAIEKHNLAWEDFITAFNWSTLDKEREMIKCEMDKAISGMNKWISQERKKMWNFDYKEDEHFSKLHIMELNSAEDWKDDDQLILMEEPSSKDNIRNTSNGSYNDKTQNKVTNKPIVQKKEIIKKEELNQFVYDITSENWNASSFKYAFKNFGDDIHAKGEYLKKVNPAYFSKIFKTDLDKDTWIDIIKCLKGFDNHGQIVEYLKGITKVNRIKWVLQWIPKKGKTEIIEWFDHLEKGAYLSEAIPIKDFFLN